MPQLRELKDAVALASGVDPLERAGIDDYVDPLTGRLAYRFFRDCELAPFVANAEEYLPLNGWYLSEASFLAYVSAKLDADSDPRAEAALVAKRVLPTLTRLFEAQAPAAANAAADRLRLHCIVHDLQLLGMRSRLHCYVVDDGKIGFVVFRGTQPSSFSNWLTDCEISMLDPDGPAAEQAMVHEGFWHASTALLEDESDSIGLRRYLLERRAEAPGLKLWFAGHSLGGAVATLAAYRLGGAQGLYTFGSPRVGNDDFVAAFARAGLKHYRVVYGHDIVAKLPMDLPFLDYEHVGALKQLASFSEPQVDANSAVDLTGAVHESHPHRESLWQRARESAAHYDIGRLRDWLSRIADHSLLYYSSVLWNEFVAECLKSPAPQAPATE